MRQFQFTNWMSPKGLVLALFGGGKNGGNQTEAITIMR